MTQIKTKMERKAIRTLATIRAKHDHGSWEPQIGRTLYMAPPAEALHFNTFEDAKEMLPQGGGMKEINAHFAKCSTCDEETNVYITTIVDDGNVVCPSCVKEYTRRCGACGTTMIYDHPLQHTKWVRFGDNTINVVCADCGRAYAKCTDCGDVVSKSRMYNGRCARCRDAFNASHGTCQTCGAIRLRENLFEGYCSNCFRVHVNHSANTSRPAKTIIRYGETEARVFLKGYETGNRVFGLEWEGENGYEPSDQLQEVLCALYPWREIDLKEDGSVPKGFEIAIQPCDLAYIRGLLNLPEMMAILKKNGFKSHDCLNHRGQGKAGLHIHVNRASFGDTERKKIRAITNFAYMWQRPDFQSRLTTFSRRDWFYYCEFYKERFEGSRIADGYHNMLDENKRERNRTINFWRHKYINGNYVAIKNTKTIEIRLMRGTMIPSTIYAAVELVDLFADIAMGAKNDAEIRKIGWLDICDKVPSTSVSLKNYLKKKHLWEE